MKIHISKLDAAKRQLETAVNYFFRNGDPVSAHTLTGAAFQILDDISLKSDIQGIHRELLKNIREDKKDEVKRRLSSAKNFFKHADNDPEAIIEFNPELTTYYLWDACRMYRQLAKEEVPIFSVFELWFHAKNPYLLVDVNQKSAMETTIKDLKLDPSCPASFLAVIPLVEEIHFASK